MPDIVAFLHSEYSDLERIYLIFQIDYKDVDSWDVFIDEAEKQFMSSCKFNENLFEQFLVDSRHRTLSPDLRRWLQNTLLGKSDPTWEEVEEAYENNGPGADYVDPHQSFSLSDYLNPGKSGSGKSS